MIIYPEKYLVNLISSYIKRHIGNSMSFKKNAEKLMSLYNSRKSSCPEVDYDRFAFQFLWLFFFANYSKVNLACKQLFTESFPSDINILDLGCGSGASIVGFVGFLIEYVDISKIKSIEIDLIDYSPTQLRILKDSSKRYLQKILGNIAKFKIQCVDVRDFLKTYKNQSRYTHIIASNLLCELPLIERKNIAENIINVLSSGGFLLVIEQKETNVLRLLEEFSSWATYESKVSGPHMIEGIEPLHALPINNLFKKDFELCCGIFKKN